MNRISWPDWREPVLAIQFLTRLPTPQVPDFQPALLAGAARWFPAVGLLLGALLTAAAWGGSRIDPWLAALAATLGWAWLTGGLHLDGLADLADALGASHRDPERLLAVMKDPHLGSFGVLALLGQFAAKLVLAMLLAREAAWAALLLAPAWARWGVFAWQTLPPLGRIDLQTRDALVRGPDGCAEHGAADSLPICKPCDKADAGPRTNPQGRTAFAPTFEGRFAQTPGMAERFGWRRPPLAPWGWAAALAALSWWLAPALLLAPLAVWLYRVWLARRLGGVSGDCLGAGIELTETLCLLGAVVLAAI
ncbi:adenosylcobinamide-GDP ribazoletransferase [Chitiniphilus shinanonensis]|uniref:Adenosylcobinamide-GDP ribazoletransferase n=1 Tax=Chitiniphilus shinanonensis TaxID=553088 RepID=A0ABQ6C0L0_9NEIS|nr:adenosylcobinamide-GDP ribazoletransferase [Chitiniphilus shinanonensis]GLS05718.1 adenosylcobinamide-GDP ribazoletransferase [Chitiniphilus shinanonensis]